MKTIGLAWLAVFVAVSSSGCGGLARPNWLHPGPAAYQQAQAQQFDPYPENDVGPAIVGGRPRDFDRPSAEPLRARPPQNNTTSSPWLPWTR